MAIKVKYNSWLVPGGFIGITIYNVFLKYTEEYIIKTWNQKVHDELVNHEKIHAVQQRKLLVLPFFILYLLFYLFYFLIKWKWYVAYKAIPFEKEADGNEDNPEYYKTVKAFSWVKYINK